MPPIGDDLGFYYSYESQNDCWYSLPRYMYRHWIWNNARMADMLTPVGLYLMPLWLRALSYGVFTAAFFYIIAKFALKEAAHNYFFQLILYACIAFVFRWDAIWMEFCATYNYVWSSTLALFALYLILNHPTSSKGIKWYLAIPICFIATAMHEACGAPLAIGVILFTYTTGVFKKQNIVGKLMIIAFISGGIFTLTSPASYSRIGTMLQPEPILDMLIYSAGFVLLLFLTILILYFTDKTLLKKLTHSSWIIFASAAMTSVCFMLVSKYGGRTGWFAQIFALIAISQIIIRLKFKINIKFIVPTAAVLYILIILHYAAVLFWQIKVGTETQLAIDLYKKSPDGIIYMDYTNEPDLPWFLLNKTHGVPDDDDSYYRYRISKHYGNGKGITILPTLARSIDWNNLHGVIRLNDKFLSDKPFSCRHEDIVVDIFQRKVATINNIEYIETNFSLNGHSLYLYSPIDRDRGEK